MQFSEILTRDLFLREDPYKAQDDRGPLSINETDVSVP